MAERAAGAGRAPDDVARAPDGGGRPPDGGGRPPDGGGRPQDHDGRALLARVDDYLHQVPRSASRAERVGPFTVFCSTTAWPYYARPDPGAGEHVTAADVHALARRCAELGVPRVVEWVPATAPPVGPACEAAGWTVSEHPLLVVEPPGLVPAAVPPGVHVGPVPPEPAAMAEVWAVVRVAFAAPGTAVGDAGPQARDVELARGPTAIVEALVDRGRRGLTVTVAAGAGDGLLAVGQHQPVGAVSEVVAVGTLPARRRQGLAAAVTTALVRDAADRGVDLVLLSAADDAVARVYEGVGFRVIGSVATARAP